MAGWAIGDFNYTMLLQLVDQEISVFDYLKANYVFLALIAVSVLLLALWLFLCLPKVFCRWCRKCCCCIREKRHKLGYVGRVVVVAVGGAAVVLAFIFAVVAASTEASGINGVRTLQCHMYTTVGEMIKGSNPEVQVKERFIGVSPLAEDIRDLSAKLDVSNPDSLLTDLRDQIEEDFNFKAELAASVGSLKAFRQSMGVEMPENSAHVCYGCNAISESSVQELLDKYEQILGTDMDMSEFINQMFKKLNFPSIVLDEIIPVNEIEEVVKNATDALAETQPTISSSLTMAEVSFALACSFVILMVAVGAVWLVFFFIRSGKTGTKLACIQWNTLCVCMFVLLIVAGVFGFVMDLLMRGCQYTTTVLVEKDDWSWIIDKVDPERQSPFGLIVDGCLADRGSGDLVEIFGYKEEFDNMVAEVKDTIKRAVENLPEPPELPIQGLDEFGKFLQQIGWVVTVDPKKAGDKIKTFPEFIVSGVQEEDVEIVFPGKDGLGRADSGKKTKLAGLKTLEKLVHPWKFSALRPDETPDKFTITATYPNENDPFLAEWLQSYSPGRSGKEIPGNVDARTQMKNAIWWSVQKHKVLSATYDCPYYDAAEGKLVGRKCPGSTVFAYSPDDWSRSSIVSSSAEMIEQIKRLLQRVKNSIPTGTASATDILFSVIEKVTSMVEGINCKFMRRAFVQGSLIACDQTFLPLFKAARYCAMTAGFLLLWIIVLLIVWRKLKDNSVIVRQASE
uniref:Putative transmembrane protein n=1 Tax=Toxoplasma gondii COUG TaxID=1074873 RepID=A0A2G8YCL6_TOXGO|nr:putative transmembrane protein [Toxoplasma gondii COUG]